MITELPWDWSEFTSSFKDGRIEFDENDIIMKIDDNTIKFAKIKFKVDSVVYEKVTVDEIIEGYNELNMSFDFVRVIEVMLKSMIIRTGGIENISKFEPEIVDFLKICYWYNRLKDLQTIQHRRKEIRSRLCKKLLYKLEKDKRTIDYADLTDEETEKRINDVLNEIRAQSPQDECHTLEQLNIYLNFVNVCISELMFPALADELKIKIDFAPANNNYDYDMTMNGHSVQIKTLFSYDIYPICKAGRHKQEEYHLQSNKIREMYDRHQITWEYVEKEIVNFIKHSCIDKINDALRQKAEIIILDVTRTIPGLLLDYYYTDDYKFVKIYDSFIEVLRNQIDGYVNIIFASTVYDDKFRISSLAIKVPVVRANQVDELKKNEIYIKTNLEASSV